MDADADVGGTRMWHGLGASTVMLQMSAPLTTHSWHHGEPCLTLQHSVPADRRAVPTCPHTPPPSPALPALGEAEQNFNFNVHRACKGKKKINLITSLYKQRLEAAGQMRLTELLQVLVLLCATAVHGWDGAAWDAHGA